MDKCLVVQLKFDRQLPSAWLIGGSSKLGLSIADRLENKYNIVNLSRRSAKADSDRYFNVAVDLADIPQVRSTIKALLHVDNPRALVFCQRYRPSPGCDDVDVLSGINTEIISTQNIIEELIGNRADGKCSIVVISSVNGVFVNKQLPFWYHWLKSSQIHLVRFYSIQNSELKINVNCVIAGSFLKDNIASYPEHHKIWLENLSRVCPIKRNTSVQDIAAVVEFLISDQAAMVNGQIITVDGGITNILQETLI